MSVHYDREGPVAVVTVDRPDRRNAIDRATADALLDAWTRFEEGDAAVGVLTGSEGTFSAGADLKAMAFGGVATGSANPKDAATAPVTARNTAAPVPVVPSASA